ncbi:hypothetical protein FAZ15_12075 [Sphingobacterium olei]|uniref:PBCV-specific basic adaptor domain-containing protein n=1 Tax=Sphingobacterium olei TaxID=2571155 RepID=A0A4U0P0I5_9SPHI|nr:hypothetical protein [Sphingobacterium olei]TJZ60716.1 hypothetical protein FAZ15_12075 [Sphingobacterium olei]
MKRLINLRNLAAIVVAVSMMGWTNVNAQEQSKTIPPPKKTKELLKTPKRENGMLDTTKNVTPKKSLPDSKTVPSPKMEDKATGEKHNGFDVLLDKDKKKYYLDKDGKKVFLDGK